MSALIPEPDDPQDEIDRLRKLIEATNARRIAERDVLLGALKNFRSLVQEGGVPRYTITPGAALNSLIEEEIDPIVKSFEEPR